MVDGDGPLSWRDVYKAVNDSEERILSAIREIATPLERRATDHEARLRAVEIGGAAAVTLATAVSVQDGRIKTLEAERDKRSGVFTFLSTTQKFVLLITSVVGTFVTILTLVGGHLIL